MSHLGLWILKKGFKALAINRDRKKRLAKLFEQVQLRHVRNAKKRFMNDMVDGIVIQPRLDAIGKRHFYRKQLLKFKKKIDYIRDRRQGRNLHEFEIRAFNALGESLLRKAMTSFKISVQCK